METDLRAFVEAGLYDPASPKAAERRELLEHLLGRFEAQDIIDKVVVDGGAVYSVAVALTAPGPERLSARQIAHITGADLDKLVLIRNALGFPVLDPDEESIPATVIGDLQLFELAEASFGTEKLLAFIRVLGASTSRLTEAARVLFASSLTEDQTASVTELEVSMANELAMMAWATLPQIIHHLMQERTARTESFVLALLEGDLEVAIVFVDLVGSTSWGAALEPHAHTAALSRFEQAAWDLAAAHGGRVVKLIGDEAMIVAESPESATRIAVALCAVVDADASLPAATGAVGFGAVTARDGDYFGPLVNLVARATKAAGPGEVVVTEDVAGRLTPGGWSLGEGMVVPLRGIEEPVTLHVAQALSEA